MASPRIPKKNSWLGNFPFKMRGPHVNLGTWKGDRGWVHVASVAWKFKGLTFFLGDFGAILSMDIKERCFHSIWNLPQNCPNFYRRVLKYLKGAAAGWKGIHRAVMLGDFRVKFLNLNRPGWTPAVVKKLRSSEKPTQLLIDW